MLDKESILDIKLPEASYHDLESIRKYLHQNPELSCEEFETASVVAHLLKSSNPDRLLENVGGTGIIAEYNGEANGSTIMFRCELDALPIQEINKFDYLSVTEGKSHKCGHDGHMAIIIALASMLGKQKPKKGKVVLLFQPGEEDGRGAKAVFEDPVFKTVIPDFVFALHNLPGYSLGEVVLRRNSFNAAVTSLIIRLNGKTSHAAEPEMGINPSNAISKILADIYGLSNNTPSREDFTLITPVHLQMGEIAYGISAGHAEIHLTLRTWTQEHLDKLCERVLHVVGKTCQQFALPYETEFTHSFQANKNHDSAVDLVERAIEKTGSPSQYRPYPFKWGEDFGLFTQHYPGALIGIGSGEDCPALHNPDYDFPDTLIEKGATLFNEIYQAANE